MEMVSNVILAGKVINWLSIGDIQMQLFYNMLLLINVSNKWRKF